MATYFRLIVPPKEPNHNMNIHKHEPQRIWRRNQDKFNNEECSLSLQVQHKKSGWYVDNGCSKNITGDKNRFLTLNKEHDESVSFGNDNSYIITGRCKVKLGNKYAKEENALLVKDTKNNLLSVSQMCDQGHKLLFPSEKSEIRKEGSGKMVATARRAPNNIFFLNDNGRGKCFLGK
jgi:hypothetical protein